MLNHALFYPDWDISDPVFLAESLLYWDQLACIVPFLNFSVQPSHPDEEMRKALAEAHEKYVFPLRVEEVSRPIAGTAGCLPPHRPERAELPHSVPQT